MKRKQPKDVVGLIVTRIGVQNVQYLGFNKIYLKTHSILGVKIKRTTSVNSRVVNYMSKRSNIFLKK